MERIIVQGGIAVLLVVLGIEGTSYARLKMAESNLSAELKKAEETDHRITRSVVDQVLGGRKPDHSANMKINETAEERFDGYYFDGILKRRELWVHYGIAGLNSEPEVLEITTVMPHEVLAL